MAYSALIQSTDRRLQSQACTPQGVTNVYVERTPAGEKRRAQFFLRPTEGLVAVADLPADCRGLFSQVGCRSGDLFAAAGGAVLQIASSYSYSTIGSVTGGDAVGFSAFRTNLAVRAFGVLYLYDGSFTAVTDVDAPTFASTLAVVQFRAVAAYQDGDGFSWSGAGTFGTWPSGGAAADLYLPDKIVAQLELDGRLASFNAASTQFWDPTLGAETEAFQLVQGVNIPVGAAGREAVGKTRDGGAVVVGHDRCIYKVNGVSFQRLQNRDIEVAMEDLSDDELAAVKVWSYYTGSKEFTCINLGLARAFFYDHDTGFWHERTRYGLDAYDLDFCARAFGQVFVASMTSATLWRLDKDVYTDDGEAILREITIHAPVSGDVPIDCIALDFEWYAQDDAGARPTISLEVSLDGGRSWCEPRQLTLPRLGEYGARVRDFGFGMASAEWGVLVRLRLAAAIGFGWWGLWINPSADEVP